MMREGQTDVAALAAGVVAVSVSMVAPPGPYTIFSVVIGLTMVLVLWGYVWPHRRGLPQSIALGAVFGSIAIPIGGFPLELILAQNWHLRYIILVGSGSMPSQSQVPAISLALLWLVVSVAVFIIDLRRWRARA